MNLDNMSLDKVELIDGKECCMDLCIRTLVLKRSKLGLFQMVVVL